MQLPAFVEFAEPVPSLDIKAGDHVHLTRYKSAILVRRSSNLKEVYARSLEFTQVCLHLHLTKPITLRTSEVAK